MKKSKGFTLIELLSVIVILAIISLIATPIILGVIETARKGAAESSALGYIDAVEKQIALNIMSNTNIIGDRDYTTEELKSLGVKFKGNPMIGTIIIDQNNVVGYRLSDGNYCVYKSKMSKSHSIIKGKCMENLWYTDLTYPVVVNGVTIDYDYDTQIYTLNGTSTNDNLLFYPLANKFVDYKFDMDDEYILKIYYISGDTEDNAIQKMDFNYKENGNYKWYAEEKHIVVRYKKNITATKKIDFFTDSYSFWFGKTTTMQIPVTYNNYKFKMFLGKNNGNLSTYIPNILDK